MSQAPEYVRQKNFLDNNPDRTDHGALNAEYDAVSTSINALRANQALLQADDGTLKAGTVGVEQLTPDAQENLSRPGPEGPQGQVGNTGPQGNPGAQGPVGASFNADARDIAANRSLYDTEPKGFSFLAMDTGLLSFKLSAASGDWSAGFVFGRGAQGIQGVPGIQGPPGLQGLRGLQGNQGIQGVPGLQGNPGVVDYSKVVRNDITSDQSIQSPLSAPSFAGALGMAAPLFMFTGFQFRLIPNNSRLRLDNGQNTPALQSMELDSLVTAGTSATNTGVKLANGADIGTMFDPAGSSAGKLASVDTTPQTVTLTGKTTLTATLSQVGGQVVLTLSAT
ncbi:hypothetical protein AVE30378_01021 [Achromobacter veterisilvae]|uniref:Collagen triple helix repeat (20 copies) n=1 Tax=Achromobacter veterisilvae TaxID=2069367 RepID=A0A446C8T1_9BURK|nr:collagen-like protein [Achromobacter veterisilvae]SSW64319.1 hypothetical protein AVE30378_01021 [Achromobacter veterisilvae]